MIKNKNGGKKKELLAEDRRKMQRLAGILKESMFFEEAPPEEEEPLPGGDDMGGDDLGMDDGGDDLGMDDGGDVPAGPEGVQSPEVEEMVNLFRDFLVAQQESGRIGISADGTENVPSAELPGVGGDPSLDVPEPDGGEGMEMEDEPEDPSLQKEAVPIPSARRQNPVREKYNNLEEDLFESVMRRVRKEMLAKSARKPAPAKKK